MRLNQLEQLLQQYDQTKGWRERLFGDALPIKVLKEFISKMVLPSKEQDNESFVNFSEYQDYISSQDYPVDLSNNYLNSQSADANLLKYWKWIDCPISELSINTIQPLKPISFDSLVSLPSVNFSVNFKELIQSQLELDTISELNKNIHSEEENIANSLKVKWSPSFFNQSSLYQHFTIDDFIRRDYQNSSTSMPDVTVNTDRATQLKEFRDIARIRRAARIIGQGYRDPLSPFNPQAFPRELCIKIAALCSDGSVSEERAQTLSAEFLKKPRLSAM